MWDGCPLTEKTLLLHAEQGLGDTLQFIRYAPLLRQRGAKIVLNCQNRRTKISIATELSDIGLGKNIVGRSHGVSLQQLFPWERSPDDAYTAYARRT